MVESDWVGGELVDDWLFGRLIEGIGGATHLAEAPAHHVEGERVEVLVQQGVQPPAFILVLHMYMYIYTNACQTTR